MHLDSTTQTSLTSWLITYKYFKCDCRLSSTFVQHATIFATFS